MTKKEWTDPFPGLPRRFGTFREIDAPQPSKDERLETARAALKKTEDKPPPKKRGRPPKKATPK